MPSEYQEGVDAFTMGVSVKCNPYYITAAEGIFWLEGFTAAFHEWAGTYGRQNNDQNN